MLFTRASFVIALATSAVAAAPLERRWGGWGNWNHDGGRPWWTPSSSYLDFGKRFPGADSNAPTCDLSQAVMPTGRGTQNYTCDLTNTTSPPVAVGAKATLFNVSCLAADHPALLAKLPSIALDLPIPSSDGDDSSPAYQDISGHHFFLDATTPCFDLDTTLHQYGTGQFKKANSSAAPTDAMLGTNGQGFGSVTWLKLDAKDAAGQVLQEVYRLNTAGGQPPKTCQGMAAAFEVQYSAEYWIWAQ
ncbi:hypothetical protein LTR03_008392 [Friedmanniomyces endolithicus]|nr:hypothetical protein LTR03_008392 [Friedmanniomyces endolithicus]